MASAPSEWDSTYSWQTRIYSSWTLYHLYFVVARRSPSSLIQCYSNTTATSDDDGAVRRIADTTPPGRFMGQVDCAPLVKRFVKMLYKQKSIAQWGRCRSAVAVGSELSSGRGTATGTCPAAVGATADDA